MIDPTLVTDRDGEWLTIENPTPLPADLSRVSLAVRGAARCDLSGTEIPAFGDLTVARTADLGHVSCPRLTLSNRRGEVALVRDGEVLDAAAWENAPKGEVLTVRPARSRRVGPAHSARPGPG